MYPRTNARTEKSHERLQLVAERLVAAVRFIRTSAMTVGRRFLAACHESQRAKAAAVIRKHRHLVDEAEAHFLKEPLEFCGRPAHRGTESKSLSAKRSREGVACLPY